ncbi:MAG: Bax inhibitor-1/YccA family protein [Acidimicrobiales bacterium]|nr:MAG: Bax inhibitor-1/YccA family protein [Acidimicrobiales bacterium]
MRGGASFLRRAFMNNSNRTVGVQSNVNLGLRDFMLGTYKYMGAAMAVSALVAYFFGMNVLRDGNGGITEIGALLYSPMAAIGLTIGIVVLFGAVGAKLQTMSISGARIFLFSFASIMGVWLSAIAAFVDPMISVKIFFMAAAMFAGLSLLGYTTKKDLGPIAKVAFMVFFGFVALNLLGMVFPAMAMTGGMGTILSLVGLVAISVITAWETQALKHMYHATVGDPEMAEKYSVYGAASLLLAFINIFSILMNLFGGE